MNTHVFLGPTLSVAAAQRILAAQYHPPAAMGDVYRCTQHQDSPGTMLIVDGYFEQVPSVRHKEILHAMSVGWRVLGCASMGALRAAELHQYGMAGLGSVFEDYRDEVLEDDDEVAVAHAAAEYGYRALSVAMVDIRATLHAAAECSAVGPEAVEGVVTAAKRMYYPDRHWPGVLASARLRDAERSTLLDFVREHGQGVKRRDAVGALTLLAEGSLPERTGELVEFRATNSWHRFVAAEAVVAG
ncbi:TfuA-like protein [Amycolatopsis sp. NPDC051061]|uniref:TfuA-like protein n=1 Tax=Amycolatopsis sp. NPDC051061 TaxID=3155042 RepID=UPI00342F6C2A